MLALALSDAERTAIIMDCDIEGKPLHNDMFGVLIKWPAHMAYMSATKEFLMDIFIPHLISGLHNHRKQITNVSELVQGAQNAMDIKWSWSFKIDGLN